MTIKKVEYRRKEIIKRIDWNHDDHATKFGGQDALKLSEIHMTSLISILKEVFFFD